MRRPLCALSEVDRQVRGYHVALSCRVCALQVLSLGASTATKNKQIKHTCGEKYEPQQGPNVAINTIPRQSTEKTKKH